MGEKGGGGGRKAHSTILVARLGVGEAFQPLLPGVWGVFLFFFFVFAIQISPADVQHVEAGGYCTLQHGAHPPRVVPHLAGHGRPFQHGNSFSAAAAPRKEERDGRGRLDFFFFFGP